MRLAGTAGGIGGDSRRDVAGTAGGIGGDSRRDVARTAVGIGRDRRRDFVTSSDARAFAICIVVRDGCGIGNGVFHRKLAGWALGVWCSLLRSRWGPAPGGLMAAAWFHVKHVRLAWSSAIAERPPTPGAQLRRELTGSSTQVRSRTAALLFCSGISLGSAGILFGIGSNSTHTAERCAHAPRIALVSRTAATKFPTSGEDPTLPTTCQWGICGRRSVKDPDETANSRASPPDPCKYGTLFLLIPHQVKHPRG